MAGDNISKQYSGTSSVLTKITLKGYQNFFDKMEQKTISGKRFFKQSLTDDFKQQCILILQGLNPESQDQEIDEYMMKNKIPLSSVDLRQDSLLL